MSACNHCLCFFFFFLYMLHSHSPEGLNWKESKYLKVYKLTNRKAVVVHKGKV